MTPCPECGKRSIVKCAELTRRYLPTAEWPQPAKWGAHMECLYCGVTGYEFHGMSEADAMQKADGKWEKEDA